MMGKGTRIVRKRRPREKAAARGGGGADGSNTWKAVSCKPRRATDCMQHTQALSKIKQASKQASRVGYISVVARLKTGP